MAEDIIIWEKNIKSVPFFAAVSKQDVDDYIMSDSLKENMNLAEDLLRKNDKRKRTYKAYCQYCHRNSSFKYVSVTDYNLREGLQCNKCGLSSRQRIMACVVEDMAKEQHAKDIYMYEQRTIFFKRVSKKLNNISFTGSEYIGGDIKPGTIKSTLRSRIRHEDAANLSFDDNGFDIVVAQDVFEHIPDINKALSEAYRVLRKKGVLLITVPFYWDKDITVKRTEVIKGKPIFKENPVYHGNPMSKKGSLVFYDFGWDFMGMLESCGFKNVKLLFFHSVEFGYLGFNNMIVAEK